MNIGGTVSRGRLPEWVRPIRYALTLEILPEREEFNGAALIEVELDQRSDSVFLHARELNFSELWIETEGGQRVPARCVDAGPDGLVSLQLDSEIGPGRATIRAVYRAPFNLQLEGLYRVEVGGTAYAFTQFQSTSARRALPCFDEPRFKTPFDVTLVVNQHDHAVANTLPSSVESLPNGRKRIHFARTEKQPSYLLAWAVGPFDLVDAPPIPPHATRAQPLPLRGIAIRGRGPELLFALEKTPAQVLALEDYFGIGYPFDKLDLLAVPDFAPGAMENPGAVTFREPLLLIDPETAAEDQRRLFADVLAHELAHMWFGNLVTMTWWDDTWLNESFASWMGNRVMQALYPEYNPGVMMLESVQGAMHLDSLKSARQIRQPVESAHDIENAFDEITYEKGMALLAMFERWLGEDSFRRGIRLYLEKHAHGNAVADDLLSALSDASGQDVATPFNTFLLQPGVPLLEASIRSDEDGRFLHLRQSRYLPIASEGRRDTVWQIPVCVRYSDGNKTFETCTLLTEPEGRLRLECDAEPAWLIPNADGAGYYRWSLAAGDLERLRVAGWASLSPRERLSFADSLLAAFETATLPAADVYAALPPLADDEMRAVAVAPTGFLRFAFDYLVNDELRPRVEAFARTLYLPVLKRLGWGRVAEPSEVKLLRQEVVAFLAIVSNDPAVRTELARLGRAYLGISSDGQLHPEALSPELIETATAVAIRKDGRPVFDVVVDHLFRAEDALTRFRFFRALGSAKDPILSVRARSLILDERTRVNETTLVLERQRDERETRDAAFAWLRQNFDAVVKRIGPIRGGSLPALAARFSDEQAAAEVEEFFAPRIESLVGGPRNLALTVERILLRAARIKAQRDSAEEFFHTIFAS